MVITSKKSHEPGPVVEVTMGDWMIIKYSTHATTKHNCDPESIVPNDYVTHKVYCSVCKKQGPPDVDSVLELWGFKQRQSFSDLLNRIYSKEWIALQNKLSALIIQDIYETFKAHLK